MLTELQLSNFKSWRELDIKLGRVTGLFGTNSSGKSSILQFLLMLKQTKDATDRGLVLDLGGQNQLVNLGSYKDLIYKHQLDLSLKWSIDWLDNGYKGLFNTSVEISFKDYRIEVNSIELIISYIDSIGLNICQFKIKNNMSKLYEINAIYNKFESNLSIPRISDVNIIDCSQHLLKNFSSSLEDITETPPIKNYIFPRCRVKNNTEIIESYYEKLMDRIY